MIVYIHCTFADNKIRVDFMETLQKYLHRQADNKAVRLTGLHKAKNLDNDNSDVWIHEGTDGTDRRAFIKTEKTYGQRLTNPLMFVNVETVLRTL